MIEKPQHETALYITSDKQIVIKQIDFTSSGVTISIPEVEDLNDYNVNISLNEEKDCSASELFKLKQSFISANIQATYSLNGITITGIEQIDSIPLIITCIKK